MTLQTQQLGVRTALATTSSHGESLDVVGGGGYGPARSTQSRTGHRHVLEKIFTWWNGATLGALFTIKKRAAFVGEDSLGNRYFEERDARTSYDGRRRRWVTYKGYAEATKVPAEWHGWLHYTFDEPPTVEPLKVQSWEKPHLPNMTGTPYAYRPAGSIVGTGERARAVGDYQAWTPE